MKTILLIEDTLSILENLCEYLELEGYRIFVSSTGKDGLELAIRVNPDLIICDILMTDMDGTEVFQKLSCNAQTAGIPFIFSTSLSENSEKEDALKLGAKAYLIKPFQMETLMEAIDVTLNSRQHV